LFAGSVTSNGGTLTGAAVSSNTAGSQWGLVYLTAPAPNDKYGVPASVQEAFIVNFSS